MSITLVGSISLDSVRTPKEEVEGLLGGSGVHFANSASLLTRINLITVVGSDFPRDGFEFLRSKGVDLDGLQIIDGGLTFRARRFYGKDIYGDLVLDIKLNVFKCFEPRIPKSYVSCNYLFISAIDPSIQLMILDKINYQRAVIVDTSLHWINSERDRLLKLLARVDIVILNEEELYSIMDEHNIIKAGKALLKKGFKYLVVKRGINGAFILGEGKYFALPAYPTEEVVDITGVGDSFSGALVSYLDKKKRISFEYLKEALAYAVILSSFCVEGFGINGISRVSYKDIKKRYKLFMVYTALPSIRV